MTLVFCCSATGIPDQVTFGLNSSGIHVAELQARTTLMGQEVQLVLFKFQTPVSLYQYSKSWLPSSMILYPITTTAVSV